MRSGKTLVRRNPSASHREPLARELRIRHAGPDRDFHRPLRQRRRPAHVDIRQHRTLRERRAQRLDQCAAKTGPIRPRPSARARSADRPAARARADRSRTGRPAAAGSGIRGTRPSCACWPVPAVCSGNACRSPSSWPDTRIALPATGVTCTALGCCATKRPVFALPSSSITVMVNRSGSVPDVPDAAEISWPSFVVFPVSSCTLPFDASPPRNGTDATFVRTAHAALTRARPRLWKIHAWG